ncbi:MAG TPA: DoxX family protein [Nevskiaceae bacterium]|nr:DoxX family protein [Nevskiaceae bacterium]
MNRFYPLAIPAGRLLLASLFLIAGLGKLGQYEGTAGYMASVGLPAALLPAVIAFEVGAALLIILGWQTRLTALLLAGFSLLSALIFHSNLADPMQQVLFLKNVSIAGGLLLLVAHGGGAYSLDARRA